ncbi:hypothetical protein [Bacillus sp. REN3]|uniref:hypothetical protein n=1 Tax=Bacillus sp. REN3 TaxID=2802440 RepID=UPI001AEE84F8|nr:hypothetical protein [Bacillus sp. REN3]
MKKKKYTLILKEVSSGKTADEVIEDLIEKTIKEVRTKFELNHFLKNNNKRNIPHS